MMAFSIEKYIQRERRMSETRPEDLAEQLCKSRNVKDVLEATGLTDKDINKLLCQAVIPLPHLKSHFSHHAAAILGNLQKYQDYLTRTAQLRSDLAQAQNDLESSYVRFDGRGK